MTNDALSQFCRTAGVDETRQPSAWSLDDVKALVCELIARGGAQGIVVNPARCGCIHIASGGHEPGCPAAAEAAGPSGEELYVPKPGERVRVVEVCDAWPNVAVGDVVVSLAASATSTGTIVSEECPGYLFLVHDLKKIGTWCRVEPLPRESEREPTGTKGETDVDQVQEKSASSGQAQGQGFGLASHGQTDGLSRGPRDIGRRDNHGDDPRLEAPAPTHAREGAMVTPFAEPTGEREVKVGSHNGVKVTAVRRVEAQPDSAPLPRRTACGNCGGPLGDTELCLPCTVVRLTKERDDAIAEPRDETTARQMLYEEHHKILAKLGQTEAARDALNECVDSLRSQLSARDAELAELKATYRDIEASAVDGHAELEACREGLAHERQDRRIELKRLSEAWSGYQRGDLSQDEFEGTVAEIAEAPATGVEAPEGGK